MNDLDLLRANARDAANFVRLMSNESRLMILCSLIDSEMSVSELNDVVPLSQSALSQHLATLRKSGLVACRKDAQKIFYSVTDDAPAKVIAVLKEIFCDQDRDLASPEAAPVSAQTRPSNGEAKSA